MSMAEVQLTPALLAEMISLIDADTISGKIGKQILPDLLAVRALHPLPMSWLEALECQYCKHTSLRRRQALTQHGLPL